jgi:hypothetical protein
MKAADDLTCRAAVILPKLIESTSLAVDFEKTLTVHRGCQRLCIPGDLRLSTLMPEFAAVN